MPKKVAGAHWQGTKTRLVSDSESEDADEAAGSGDEGGSGGSSTEEEEQTGAVVVMASKRRRSLRPTSGMAAISP